LVEYHGARGTFSTLPTTAADGEWRNTAAPAHPIVDDMAVAAAGAPAAAAGRSLTRLGPLPPLQMQPGGAPILQRYRDVAQQRYGRPVTAAELAWTTWP
ncbi:MAG: hypothetical protein ABWY93_04385, partial [Mycobacterium sp.]